MRACIADHDITVIQIGSSTLKCVVLAVQILHVHMILNESKLASYKLLTSSLATGGGPGKLASSFFSWSGNHRLLHLHFEHWVINSSFKVINMTILPS